MTSNEALARRLQPGDLVDLEPAVEWLEECGYIDRDDAERAAIESEFAIVEGVTFERPDTMLTTYAEHSFGSDEIAVVCTNLGNWAIPAEMPLPLGG